MESANRVGRPDPGLRWLVLAPALGLLLSCVGDDVGDGGGATTEVLAAEAAVVPLPEPSPAGETSLEEALGQRRSGREYTAEPLTLAELGQLLWAAQGVTSDEGGRTAPSAGARYPLELFAVIRDVEDIDPGVWRYEPEEHALSPAGGGDRTAALQGASLGQPTAIFENRRKPRKAAAR